MNRSAVVIGSAHVDLIARAGRLPGRGESVTGGTFTMAPGGKGGNQAVQLALCGIETTLVSRLGDDQFGRMLRSALEMKGVRTNRIATDPGQSTGASTVFAAEGDYASIIAPGAANTLTGTDLEAARAEIERADLVVLQRELHPAFVDEAIDFCAALGKRILLNASPAPAESNEICTERWNAIDWLIVNRFEAAVFAKMTVDGPDDAFKAAEFLHKTLGVANIVITLGREGSIWLGMRDRIVQPAFLSEVVDTVGAGDAYLGALAAGLINGVEVHEAIRRASAAGAIAVSRSGAYDALPTSEEIERVVSSIAVKRSERSAIGR